MDSIAGTPTYSIKGLWEDTAFASWGSPYYTQTKNKVEGTMGMYSVRGVMYGNKVYLSVISNGYLHYTITMKFVDKNTLLGYYVSGFKAKKRVNGTTFILKRANYKKTKKTI
jgi:hypothetical protein